jgi:hypothetical protein
VAQRKHEHHTAGVLCLLLAAAEQVKTASSLCPAAVLPLYLVMLAHTGTAHGHHTGEAAGAHRHLVGVARRHLGVMAAARHAAAHPALHAGAPAHQTTHAVAGVAAGRLTATGAARHHPAVAGRRR